MLSKSIATEDKKKVAAHGIDHIDTGMATETPMTA